jgi:hypothetical protein
MKKPMAFSEVWYFLVLLYYSAVRRRWYIRNYMFWLRESRRAGQPTKTMFEYWRSYRKLRTLRKKHASKWD